MIRHLTVAAATCLVLVCTRLSPVFAKPLPGLSGDNHAMLKALLEWLLAIVLILQANAALNSWADNRWMWKPRASDWRWEHEVAVVTGGSKGIGAMLVWELLKQGMKVAVLDIEPFSDDIPTDQQTSVAFYECDVTSRESVHQAGEALRSDLGPPSILINNAGIGNTDTILEISPKRLQSIFNVNIISHWNTVQEFLPDMIAKKKGHIMSTASMAAFLGLAGMVDYSCTKAGLVAFHEGLIQELKHRYRCPEVQTTIVYPDWTRTGMTEPISNRIKASGSPIAEPDDVAKAMVKHLVDGKSGHLVLGPKIAMYVRVVPTWLQELVRDQMANIVTLNASTGAA